MKKRVRLNTVEKDIKEYDLEEDEIEAKKRKGKKYIWVYFHIIKSLGHHIIINNYTFIN